MSDQQQGPGWWLASDGKWYPPDQAPPLPPAETWASPPPGPPPRSGMSTGAIVALVVTIVVGSLALLIGAAVLLGTSSSSSSSSSTSSTTAVAAVVPAGFGLLQGDGVSIAAPQQWEIVDPEALATQSDAFAKAFPDAPPDALEKGFDAVKEGSVLVAFDLGESDVGSNINIVEVPVEVPLAQVDDYAGQQIRVVGGEVHQTDVVQLPAGDAVRLEYTIPIALPDGSSSPVDGVQYYVPLDGHTYIVTVTADAALADRMIETFRVG
jgi:hypothetical protein